MKLREDFAAETRFEGDNALRWRSIPVNAQITSAKAIVTPINPNQGDPFAERLSFDDGIGQLGATKAQAGTWVEVDFHKRRTLASVVGSQLVNTTLQVDLGGGAYVEINKAGALKTPDPPPNNFFTLLSNSSPLPGLTVTKFKLTHLTLIPDLASVTIRSVPANVSLRLGELPPFWTHLGEMTEPETTPDFAAVLQAALTAAKVESGFYDLPLVVHSDTIGRLQVELDVEFVAQDKPLPQGLDEVVLPFDFSALPQSTSASLNVAVPAATRVAPGQTSARVRGSFAETRIVYPRDPHGVVLLPDVVGAVSVSPNFTEAQILAFDDDISATAIDLLLASITLTTQLRLDLRADLDGKPDDNSLLPAPVEFKLDQTATKEPTWLSIPLPAEFQFSKQTTTDFSAKKKRYWLVLQSLEGDATWSLVRAQSDLPTTQCSRDGGLSWRNAIALNKTQRNETVPSTGPFSSVFRLRNVPKRFEVPIELQVGAGDKAVRKSLQRFAPLGRVDFALDQELVEGLNDYLKNAGAVVCPEKEHLLNGDFEEWMSVGNEFTRSSIDVGAPCQAVAFVSNGSLAYAVTTEDTELELKAIDVVCGRQKTQPRPLPTGLSPTSSATKSVAALALDPTGGRAYVGGAEGFIVVDTSTFKKLGGPFEPDDVIALAVSPGNNELYIASASRIKTLDLAILEEAIVGGASSIDSRDYRSFELNVTGTEEARAIVPAPEGERLYAAIARTSAPPTKPFVLRVFDTSSLRGLEEIELPNDPKAIAVTPDGTLALVASGNSVIIIDTVTNAIVDTVSVQNNPIALTISPDAATAYVLNQGSQSISIVDLNRRRVVRNELLADPTITPPPNLVGQALSPQGDQIYVADLQGNALFTIQFGTRLPTEWTRTSGEVTPFCFPDPFHVVSVLGSLRAAKPAPTTLSQVVPVAQLCPYEFSFWGIAVAPDTNESPALAEVFWLSRECGLIRTDPVPIEVLELDAKRRASGLATLFGLSATQGKPPLKFHRVLRAAPAGANQAEVRFSAPKGGLAIVDRGSLIATSEVLANADFSLLREGRLADWALSPELASNFQVLAGDGGGIKLINSGAATAELVQTVAAKSEEDFRLEFQGTAGAGSLPISQRLEVRWLKADGSTAGSPTIVEILPTDFGSSAASGTVPKDSTLAEIHLVAPAGTILNVKRVSLRYSTSTPVPITFIAQAPGELRVSEVRIGFEEVEPSLPPISDQGLCTPTPPGCEPGKKSETNSTCYCHQCDDEKGVVAAKAVMTPAGRPAIMAVCASCGSEILRIGGPPGLDPQALALGRSAITGPIVIRSKGLEERKSLAKTPKLTDIRGIGEARAKQLADIGIDSVEKLAAATPTRVAEIRFITATMAFQLVEQAKSLMRRTVS
jgi:YVTN family beta-propeller protein